MIRSIIKQLNKEKMAQSFAPQTLAPKSHITFFDRKESYTKKLSERNSIRTKIVTLDLSPTNSRCSNNVGLFAVSRTFLAHSVMLGGVNASSRVQLFAPHNCAKCCYLQGAQYIYHRQSLLSAPSQTVYVRSTPLGRGARGVFNKSLESRAEGGMLW